MIAVSIFVVLLAVGLVWSSASWSRADREAQGIAACLDAVDARDPARAAREDLARGEDRPFFVSRPVAPGAAVALGISGCAAGGAFTDNRPFPFDRSFALAPRGERAASGVSDLTECGRAQEVWVHAYNAELARLDPRVSAKYCRRQARR
ncbi:hypothetical protein B2G71_01995 [Novosphingobium sp. PC22D]|nr:hypothetical protein B2G71_01995 [Novosphingobium sp. PC22D]